MYAQWFRKVSHWLRQSECECVEMWVRIKNTHTFIRQREYREKKHVMHQGPSKTMSKDKALVVQCKENKNKSFILQPVWRRTNLGFTHATQQPCPPTSHHFPTKQKCWQFSFRGLQEVFSQLCLVLSTSLSVVVVCVCLWVFSHPSFCTGNIRGPNVNKETNTDTWLESKSWYYPGLIIVY